MTIEKLNLSVRATNVLRKNGITTYEQMIGLSDMELNKMRFMDHKNFIEIREKINMMEGNND